MGELDVIGVLAGTDKSSASSHAWDYLRHYEDYFKPFKSEPIDLIEIGVEDGSSIETWLKYFDRARIIGIDVNPACAKLARDRVAIEIGSQDNIPFLHSVANKYKPTIIIDDGSHIAHHMITSFETLFPFLAPGGIYIFEDLSFHFEDGQGQWQGAAGAKQHQGLSDKSIFDYLSPFVRACAAHRAPPPGAWGFQKYACETIDSVTAFGGAVLIRKRAPRPVAADMQTFDRMLGAAPNRPLAELRYADYLLRNEANPSLAYSLLKSQTPNTRGYVRALDLRFIAAIRIGKKDEALEAAQGLAEAMPNEAWVWRRLAEHARVMGRGKEELEAVRRLSALEPQNAGTFLRISELEEAASNFKAAWESAQHAHALAPNDPTLRNRAISLKSKAGVAP